MKKEVHVYCTDPLHPQLESSYFAYGPKVVPDGWVLVGTYEVEFEPLSNEVAARAGVAALRELEQEERLKFEERMSEIHNQINKFLALPQE